MLAVILLVPPLLQLTDICNEFNMCDTFHEITMHKTTCSPIQKGKEEREVLVSLYH